MSAVGVRQTGSRLLHDTVLDPQTGRPRTRCSDRPVAVVWLSAEAAGAQRPRCVDCQQIKEDGGGPLRHRSWRMPSDPKAVVSA